MERLDGVRNYMADWMGRGKVQLQRRLRPTFIDSRGVRVIVHKFTFTLAVNLVVRTRTLRPHWSLEAFSMRRAAYGMPSCHRQL
jgi:hypothetical protein